MKKLMAANWKMYKTPEEARSEAEKLSTLLQDSSSQLVDKEVLLFVPAIDLLALSQLLDESRELPFMYGAQNFYPAMEGAFTGENSLEMVRATKAGWVLVGHSERRAYFKEDNALLATKAEFALQNGFRVVFCVGETLEERESGQLQSVIKSQLQEGLAKLPSDYDAKDFAIAYEPVWAIGTGKVASESDIEEAHALVRAILSEIIFEKSSETRILYGGSVKPDNAVNIMKIENVDGVLVGGASLQASSFIEIVLA